MQYKPLIIANWKMNPQSLVEAKRLFGSVKKGLRNIKRTEVVICPPSVYLSDIKNQAAGIKLGSQNCFWEEKGAFTGEISAVMLKKIGCQYVIIGHSERREIFKETDEMINQKLKAVIKTGLKPILCIGETGEEKEQEKIVSVFKKQIKIALSGVAKSKISKSGFCIAYEPIWAIGSGEACGIDEAMSAKLLIQKILISFLGKSLTKKIPILYGGSVTSKNARDFIDEAGMNGLLIGGASLNSQEFIKIVKIVF
ncbi:triose-phosphate isomerase [Candidatus Parcubacteria bacterium]|nr:triose-phosphate isomerase [Candidatus Parcubacteria bacterium]